MEQKLFHDVCQEIYHKFPQLSGCKPTIKQQAHSTTSGNESGMNYLLVFTNKGKPKNELPVVTWVRVLVSEQGKILKLTSSR